MRFSSLALGSLFCLLAAAPTPARAARVMFTPTYGRVFNVFWTKVPPFADGTQIGFVLTAFINLTNFSSSAQTGKIEAVSGFLATGGEFGRNSWPRHLFLCADTATSSDGTTDSTAPPAAVTFSIPAQTTRMYRTGIFYKSTYCAAGTSCHTGLGANFTPALKITINEDRGAVSGTLVHVFSQPITGVALCDGSSMDNYEMETTLSSAGELSGTPLMLNGGRPF